MPAIVAMCALCTRCGNCKQNVLFVIVAFRTDIVDGFILFATTTTTTTRTTMAITLNRKGGTKINKSICVRAAQHSACCIFIHVYGFMEGTMYLRWWLVASWIKLSYWTLNNLSSDVQYNGGFNIMHITCKKKIVLRGAPNMPDDTVTGDDRCRMTTH